VDGEHFAIQTIDPRLHFSVLYYPSGLALDNRLLVTGQSDRLIDVASPRDQRVVHYKQLIQGGAGWSSREHCDGCHREQG